jgi:hypothetical protein
VIRATVIRANVMQENVIQANVTRAIVIRANVTQAIVIRANVMQVNVIRAKTDGQMQRIKNCCCEFNFTLVNKRFLTLLLLP